MKKTIAILITSICAIALCVGLIVGSTFSLLSSSDRINISISSASLDLEAYITNFKLYSAKPDENGGLTDENGKTYSYVEFGSGKFANGGTAEITEGGNLEFTGVSAGDKVEFDIVVTNGVHDGRVNPDAIRVKYQTVLKLVEQDESRLFENLEFGVSVRQTDGAVETFPLNGTEYNTTYRPLEVEDSETVHISIALPVDADNGLQGLAAKLSCTLSAVQGTENAGVALVGGNDFMRLSQAVAYAQTYGYDTIQLTDNDTATSTGDVEISKSLNFESLDGGTYAFRDARFTVTGGAALNISNMGFTGNSYINLAEASSFAFENSEAVNCSPARIYNSATQEYLDRAAFIVSDGNQSSPVRLDISNSRFTGFAENALAVYLNSVVADGSQISENTFGGENGAYTGSAIELQGSAGYATLTVGGNTFYAQTSLVLGAGQSGATYTVKLNDNVNHGERYVATLNSANAELYDGGSVLNGRDVTVDDIYADGGLFAGVNVEFDVNGLVTAGTFKLLGTDVASFRAAHVSPDADANDIEIYVNGELQALNNL